MMKKKFSNHLVFVLFNNRSTISKTFINHGIKSACIAFLLLCFGLSIEAQYNATWGLTSTTNKTSATSGIQATAVNAGLMAPGSSFPIPGTHNIDGYRCQISTSPWPTVATDGFHLDFPLSPNTGYDLNISGLTLTGKTSGSSGNNLLSLAYQVDGTGPWVSFGAVQTLPSGGTNNVNFGTLSTTLPSSHTYVIRLYVYAAGTTTSSRSVYIKDVVFSGNAALAGPPPTVQTTSATTAGVTSANVSGSLVDAGSWPVTTSGFCWSLTPDPTISLSTISTNGPTSIGTFNYTITGLAASTTYYVRAYATSAVGTSYGATLTFTTLPPVIPTVNTLNAVVNSPVTALGGGVVTDDGGVSVTQRGVCWNTSGNPVYPADANTSNGSGVGTFSSFLASLSPNTTYYVRAYAINSVGIAYGNVISFTTPPPTPTLVAVPDSLAFGSVLQGTSSAVQSYTLTGYFLSPATGNISIVAPSGYRISTSATGSFSSALSLPYTGSSLASTTIYVIFSPNALVSYNKTISNSGGGAPTKIVKLTGAIEPAGGQGQQGFSNRGTDFWTGFGPHEKISGANGTNSNALMTLYFSADSATVVDVYVGANLIQTINVAANTITASNPIPWTGADDARLTAEGVYVGKGIYVHSSKPIVAYAEIYGSSVTAASVLFPNNTLGKSYTALNYQQISNSSSSNSRSYCFAVATQDNTTVEVTLPPGITSESGLTGVNVRTLNKGDVWLIKGGDNITDITGTQIKSISAAGSSCQPIAVFSGSGKISITCDGGSSSGDNLFQQCFPSVAWGRKYVSAPTAGAAYANNIYRVMINPDYPSTVVTVNGISLPNAAPIPGITNASTTAPSTSISLTNNLYYEFKTDVPVVINATSPVMVAQYITNKSKCGNSYAPSAGDPDMIYLSSVEQTIDKIIVTPIATQSSNSTNFINVIIKTADVPNFTIVDQNSAPVTANFVAIDATHSYAQISIPNGYSPGVFYKLQSTRGAFNAISYGYSGDESYAYNAGTNLVDLFSGFSIQNEYGSGSAVAACKGSQFYMSVTLAFKPVNIVWDFNNNANLVPNNLITQSGSDLISPQVLIDSVIINGVQLYTYRIPTPFVYNDVSSFNVKVLATSPTPDGCNGIKEYNFPINVVQGPSASFSFSNTSGCLNPIQFNDLSAGNGGLVNAWSWNFGDALPGVSNLQNPSYTYTQGGTYQVKLRAITNEGCYADTTKTLSFSGVPSASFTAAAQACVNVAHLFTNNSTIVSGSITQWNWNFGDGSSTAIVNATSGANQSHTFATPGSYNVTLTVITSTGCSSTVFSLPITVNSLPVVTFNNLSGVCNTASPFALTAGNPATVAGVGTGTYSGPGVASGIFSPSVAGVGTHQLTYNYVTQAGCTSSATQSIVVSQSANLVINPVTALCANGDAVLLSANIAGGVFSGNGVSGNQFNPMATGAGTFTVGYSIPSNPCTIPGNLQIVVNPVPSNFDAGNDVLAIYGNATFLIGNGSSSYSYLWSPATSLNNPQSLVTGLTALNSGTYTLTATNSYGCKATDVVELTVLPICVKPSGVFTPNNDGYYDKWVVVDGSCTRQVKVSVYNRWGGLVYSNDNYQNNWDGTYNGKNLPDGTYYYSVTAILIDGSNVTKRGNVTIMR